MEDDPAEKKIIRTDQVYVVGGTFSDPSDFTNKVNRNLIILHESNKDYKIKDIKFNIFNDPHHPHTAPIYLAKKEEKVIIPSRIINPLLVII
ncbi:MAG: hypothetical protein P8Y97_24075 [Candidatus Lokiarchaeota archaeon]